VLTQVDAINVRSDTLQLPLLSAANGYAVRDIQGLGPVVAQLTSSSLAQLDGAQPQNARRDIRNITMKLGLVPNYVTTTVDSLRQGLYDYFMPTSNVGLVFWKDGSIYALTSGVVEDFQNTMFTDNPEADLSIVCYDPDFYAPAVTSASHSTVSTTDVNTISYAGNSDAGVVFTLSINRSLPSLDLYNTAPDNSVQHFSMGGLSFVSGDTLTINSIPGQKSATLTRGGISSSALSYVDPTAANWITLQRGDNDFRAFCSGAAIPYILSYTTKYGGL
jgi:hypothetical protein